VYVKQHTGGGGGGEGGWPILFTFNGDEYLQEGLLNIHDSGVEDIILLVAITKLYLLTSSPVKKGLSNCKVVDPP